MPRGNVPSLVKGTVIPQRECIIPLMSWKKLKYFSSKLKKGKERRGGGTCLESVGESDWEKESNYKGEESNCKGKEEDLKGEEQRRKRNKGGK